MFATKYVCIKLLVGPHVNALGRFILPEYACTEYDLLTKMYVSKTGVNLCAVIIGTAK